MSHDISAAAYKMAEMILSNINRNAKPNRTSAEAPKKPKWNKSRESTDPIPVLLLSLESQTIVFQPFDFH